MSNLTEYGCQRECVEAKKVRTSWCREASSRHPVIALRDTGGTRTAAHRGTDGHILVLEKGVARP